MICCAFMLLFGGMAGGAGIEFILTSPELKLNKSNFQYFDIDKLDQIKVSCMCVGVYVCVCSRWTRIKLMC